MERKGGLIRLQARLKLGFYPLPDAEAARIGGFLEFPAANAVVVDPCAGTGAALAAISAEANVMRYAIELDAHRASEARKRVDEVINGNAFDCHAPVESFSLLYLNPPYDFEVSEGKNQRMERLFLEYCYRWLKPGGVLIMVVPFDQIYDCRTVLTPQFRDKAIYRLTESESVRYKQVVLFGIRRTRHERDKLTDWAVQQANQKLWALTRRYEEMPGLPDTPDRTFLIPAANAAKLEHKGLPLDLVEDLLAASPASLQARRVTHAQKAEFTGRPLISLHKGHVGLLCTSGLLNGLFGAGEDRHIANWEAVKVMDQTEEQDDDGSTVIRAKERFSQRLTLLFQDGRFALLSENGTGKENPGGQCAPTDGQADVCPADEGHHHACDAAP